MNEVALRRLALLCGMASAAVLLPCSIARAQPVPVRQIPQGGLRATTLRSPARAPEVTPPITVAVQPRPDSVILKTGSTNTVVQGLRITRQHSVASLRTNPVIAIANARIDLTPVLANRDSLPNIAGRLRSQPSLATDVSDDMQVFEVEQDLIIRQFFSPTGRN